VVLLTSVLIIILIIISIISRQKIKKLKGKVKFLRSKIKELIEFGKKTKDKLEEQNKEFIDFKQEINERLNNLERNNQISDQDVAKEVQSETEKLEEKIIADSNETKVDIVEDKDSGIEEIREDSREQEVRIDNNETKVDTVEEKDSSTEKIREDSKDQKQSWQEVSKVDNQFEDLGLKTDKAVEEKKEDIETEIKKEQEERNKNLRQVLAGKIFEPYDKAVWGKKLDFDFNKMLSFEYWLNKIGIALVLLGVIFLFKYSFAQGWITDPIKVFIGLLIGMALEVAGLKIYKNRLRFGQVLIGGGIGVLYTTGFAAFQLYDIIPYLSAFIFMLAVTGYAYYLSIRQEEMVLALIGFIGGIGTPFLLATGQGDLANLMLYLCFIVGGTALIYLYKGWQVLLWISILGLMYWGHSYIILAWLIETIVIHLIAKKKSLKYLTAFSHIVFAILSIWTLTRISLRIENYSSFMINLEMLTDLIVLGSTLLVGNKIIKKELRTVYLLVPHFIFLGWLYQFFSGLANGNHYTMWAWIIEGIIVYIIAERKDDFNIELSAYSVFVALAMWIAVRIFKVGSGIPILNFAALTEMIILSLVLGVIKLYDKNIELKYCKLLSALLLAGIFFREFKGLSNGYSYVIILWTIIGVWLYFDAQKNADGFMKISSQVIFGILASWILYRIFKVRVGTPIFNLKTLSDILVVSCIALYAYFEDDRKKALGYGSFCYLSMLILFYKELVHLTNGQGYITVAWGIYAIAILVFGLRKDSKSFISTALGTLILIVVKLFMIDLANVKAIWKILLFIGFGVVLLIISYYLQILWKPKLEGDEEIEQ
jgi:hypothetical protein